jgi:LysM repeat protein
MASYGSIGVIRDRVSGLSFGGRVGERMYLVTEDGKISYSFHLAPREIDYGGFNQAWVETERSGNTPLLLRKGDNLDTMSFTFMMVETRNRDFVEMTESILALKAVAKSRLRVLVSYSRLEAGLWRVTDASASSVLRHPDPANNEPIQATATVKLTRASDPAVAIGPVSGGTQPAPAAPKPAPPRTHTVVKGDTLWGISQRYYGKGASWPRIFDANRSKIKDPHWIYPGQVFVIP